MPTPTLHRGRQPAPEPDSSARNFMTDKILFVDDDLNLLKLIEQAVSWQFNVETALGGAEGLHKIADRGPFALVVADMDMPGMSGLEFLRRVERKAPETVRLMLTGISHQQTAADAVNDGRVFGFLHKTCPIATLTTTLEAGLKQFRRLRAERELLENTLGGAIHVLTEILSMIDPATFERGQRLRDLCRQFAAATGLAVTWETEIAATLLAIGRVTIPPSVLEKERQKILLSVAEEKMLRQVPELGARLLEKIPRLEGVAAIVRFQQKHFDGSGFPDRAVAGPEIPPGARLLKFLGDLAGWEARDHTRRCAWEKMQRCAGHYDPEILSAAAPWCEAEPAEESAAAPAREARIQELRAGQILAQDVLSPDGLLLMAAGSKLTGMLLAKLHNFRRLQLISATLLVREC